MPYAIILIAVLSYIAIFITLFIIEHRKHKQFLRQFYRLNKYKYAIDVLENALDGMQSELVEAKIKSFTCRISHDELMELKSLEAAIKILKAQFNKESKICGTKKNKRRQTLEQWNKRFMASDVEKMRANHA